MPKFSYSARTTSGPTATGEIEAPDIRSAVEKLKAWKLIPIEVKEVQSQGIIALFGKFNPFRKKVKINDIVIFSRQLSTMVSAGVPIVQGLGILSEQADNPVFRKVIGNIKSDIEAGISLPEAMKNQTDVFSELYVAMIKAGDEGGILDTILQRLSQYLEDSEELKRKVKSALMYPLIISIVMVGVVVFLMVFVIPRFTIIFASFGGELPLPTRLMISVSNLLKRIFPLLILLPPFGAWGFKKLNKIPSFRFKFDSLKLKLPLFGLLLRKVAIAKFSRTLGTLIKAGVPIMQSLETVAKTSGNSVIEKAIMDSRDEVKKGENMTTPLKKSGRFPPMVIQMLSVGEETGNLDTMLIKIAEFYDSEIDAAVKGLTSMIEPLVMVVMGIVVGGMVIAMFLPMFEMGQLVSG